MADGNDKKEKKKVFPNTTEYVQNVLQMLLKMNYIFYLNAQNTMKTENQCCLKL